MLLSIPSLTALSPINVFHTNNTACVKPVWGVNLTANIFVQKADETTRTRKKESRYSPINVAKTVKLRAEVCCVAVCFPSFGM